MTEDMLRAHADVLTQLGTTEEGARIRAQMQSACLLSDMEAFKVIIMHRLMWGHLFIPNLSILLFPRQPIQGVC